MTVTADLTQVQQMMQSAAQHLNAGDAASARRLLEQVLSSGSVTSDAFHLFGASLYKLGDPIAAEAPVRKAIELDPRQPAYHLTLGDVLATLGWSDLAEQSFRAALKLDPAFVSAARQLSLLLVRVQRPQAALDVIAPFALGPSSRNLAVLNAYGGALRGLGRLDEALKVYRQAVEVAPASGVAEHNLAVAFSDLGMGEDAKAASRRALGKGVNAPETHLVHARAQLALGELDGAETSLRDALKQNELYFDAHRDLAQLVWMRTEDKAKAVEAIDQALRRDIEGGVLLQLKASVLTSAGDAAAADQVLQAAVERFPSDAALRISAAQAAIAVGDVSRALHQAERVRALSPAGDPSVETFLCEVYLANGEAERAVSAAEALARRFPKAQQPLAYLATAWRMLGDARYRDIYDYAALVKASVIETPTGWGALDDYLADLALALNAKHTLKTHPLEQSLRQGSQVSDLLQMSDAVIKAFPQAVDGPIRDYIAALGPGNDPLRARNTGEYRFQGVWSVKLRSGGGHHVNHLHPEGWLSTACYIELPKSVEREPEGWISFGEPGVATSPHLDAEHYVRPEPGLVALFPSYMWHGTVPFTGHESRLTVAFDIVPADGETPV